jgi:signal transduction histidine kinase
MLQGFLGYALLICCLPFFGLIAQPIKQNSSALASLTDDSLKVMACYQYGEQFELSHPDSARIYYQMGRTIARKIKYARGEATYAGYAIVLLNNEGKYKEALKLTQEALQIFESGVGTPRDLAVGLINIANEWQYLGDLEAASRYYLKAADQVAKIKDPSLQRICYNNLASLYIELKAFGKTITYASMALSLAEKMKDDYARASSMINLATGKTEKGRYSESLILYDSVKKIGQRTSNPILEMDALNGKGEVYARKKNGDSSLYFFKQLLESSLKNEFSPYTMLARSGLGNAYWQLGRQQEGLQQILQAITLADSMGALLEKKNYLLTIAEMQEVLGKTDLALTYRKAYESTADSLLSQNRQRDILLEEARYQSTQREQQLTVQEALLKKRRWQLILLLSALVGVLLFGWLVYRNITQKRLLQKQEIEDLEKEKMLLASQALLRGQEAERSRLARDLHDGLGGMLSGIKLSLSAMKGNMILTENYAQLFASTLDKLDETMGEMRRVAHSMMPEALIRLGLGEAIHDFCNGIQATGKLNISFQMVGNNQRLPADTEIVIYRIVQELMNNIMKHAKATQVLVQISMLPPLCTVTVEDNGLGFDQSKPSADTGAGLSNVRSRVDYLKGKIDIQTSVGMGTSVFIEIPVEM